MFDDLTDAYEALIDWPKRLANEAAFYRRWFERAGVRAVVDVACGSGRHAAMFFDWGLQVEGADLSENMIRLAGTRCGEPAGLRWVVRGFDAPIEPAQAFDAAICVGNSLALGPDMATAERAIQQMLAAVRGGGLVVVQVVNVWSLPDGPCVWQKCKRAALPRGASLVLKGMHRCGAHAYVDFAVADLSEALSSKGAPPWDAPLQAESVPLLGFEAADLQRTARRAGAVETDFFGGYQEQPYDREKSTDLILVARK